MLHKFSTYPTYNIPTIASKMTRRTSNASWAPVPTTAERTTKLLGGRKTSPWTSFQPDSSLTSLSWIRGNVGIGINTILLFSKLLPKKKKSTSRWRDHYQSFQIIIFSCIFCIVIPQCTHQYHWHQASKEDNHHEWVKNWEPMDLQTERWYMDGLIEPELIKNVDD